MFANNIANLVLLTVEITLLYTAGRMVSQYLVYLILNSRKLVRIPLHILYAPGVTMHETSHAIVALCFGGSIGKFVPYHPEVEEDGSLRMGYVEYGVARPNPISGFMIGIAPLIGVPLLLFGLGALMVHGAGFSDGLLGMCQIAVTNITSNPISVQALTSLGFIYLLASGSLGLLPSVSDHRDLVPFLIILGICTAIVLILGQAGIFAAALPVVKFLSQLLLPPTIVTILMYFGMNKHKERFMR